MIPEGYSPPSAAPPGRRHHPAAFDKLPPVSALQVTR